MRVQNGLEMHESIPLCLPVVCELLGIHHYQMNHLYSMGCQQLWLPGGLLYLLWPADDFWDGCNGMSFCLLSRFRNCLAAVGLTRGIL